MRSQAADAAVAGAATGLTRRTTDRARTPDAGKARGAAWTLDETRWPDVFAVPRSGVRAAIAWAVFSRAVARLPILVRLPGEQWLDGGRHLGSRQRLDGRRQLGDGWRLKGGRHLGSRRRLSGGQRLGSGRRLGGGSAGAPEMVLHRPGDFCARVGASGLIGFGESYMAGDWDCADLTGLITAFARGVTGLVPRPLQRLRRVSVRRQPAAERSTLARARRNVSHHYDLSNELFALFLDETMTYSAALFEVDAAGTPATGAGTPATKEGLLAAAQRRKIDRLLDLTGVGPGTRVLEIGTGWGELAIRAAARGATVRTITLSERQRALAMGRIADAGLAGRVSVELRDYRDVHGQYDAILSVEMIEAVGERYWAAYFEALDRLLAPGGRIGLQAITMAHDRMLATRDTYTWILKYIFPGGLIPSVTAIEETLNRHTRLRVAERFDFGSHYEQTLRIWRERFTARQAELPGLGFDEVFARMWRLYLSYSEAGFASSYLNVCQFLLERAR